MKTVLIYLILIVLVGGLIWFLLKKRSGDLLPSESPSLSASTTLPPSQSPLVSPEGRLVESTGGLKIQDLKFGRGREIKTGDTAVVNYIGRLENGTKFDSSYDRGQTFLFKVGARQVIAGWDLGLPGMKEGGKRLLIIPAALGYGATGAGDGVIPPNATLIFEVELVRIESSN